MLVKNHHKKGVEFMSIYTDIAKECASLKMEEKENRLDFGCYQSIVKIDSAKKERIYGKPRGEYYLLDCPNLNALAPIVYEYIIEQVASYLRYKIEKVTNKHTYKALVVCLGNENIVSDSLGASVFSKLITSPLSESVSASGKNRTPLNGVDVKQCGKPAPKVTKGNQNQQPKPKGNKGTNAENLRNLIRFNYAGKGKNKGKFSLNPTTHYHQQNGATQCEFGADYSGNTRLSEYERTLLNCYENGTSYEDLPISKFHSTTHTNGEDYTCCGNTLQAVKTSVFGKTGINTAQLTKGIKNITDPDVVILIDSLCSKSLSRIGSSIQIADAGLVAGGAIGRQGTLINAPFLKCPTLAVGMPFIVRVETIVNEVLSSMSDVAMEENKTMSAKCKNLLVAPKDIDVMVELGSHLIASAINLAVLDLTTEQQRMIKI